MRERFSMLDKAWPMQGLDKIIREEKGGAYFDWRCVFSTIWQRCRSRSRCQWEALTRFNQIRL